jgi:hypothetical protein
MNVTKLSSALALVGLLIGFAQISAPEPSKAAARESGGKTIVSGGDNMGTYIEAVQANFGKPNVTVTLPTMNAGENRSDAS